MYVEMVKNFICCGLSVDISLHGNEGPKLPQKFSLYLKDFSLWYSRSGSHSTGIRLLFQVTTTGVP